MLTKHGHCVSRSSRPEVFLRKGILNVCSKFTGEHPCRSVISIKLQSNFIEIALRHGFSPVNLLHLFRTPFLNNTYALDSCFCLRLHRKSRDFKKGIWKFVIQIVGIIVWRICLFCTCFTFHGTLKIISLYSKIISAS